MNNRRSALFACLLALLAATQAMGGNTWLELGKTALHSAREPNLSDSKIAAGLKEALRVGTKKAVATVGHNGGFMNNKNVHIPLPGPLAKIKKTLKKIGASGMADDLEQRMNKAAETAAPKAAAIFGNAISGMSIDDARSILSGPPDSATQYFKRSTSPELRAAIKPIIRKHLASAGAVKSLGQLTSKVKTLPFTSGLYLDLNDYVVDKTLDGIFYYLAKQEADIRANPAARTTDLLHDVFK